MQRPKGFGKSLLLDTMKQIWEGNKDLFQNCTIGASNYDWIKHHVLRFDFSAIEHRDRELENSIMRELRIMAEYRGISIEMIDIPNMLRSLLRKLTEKGGKNKQNVKNVVILVDEYDAPIKNHLENRTLLDYNIIVLQEFYAAIKSFGKYIRFFFVMGDSSFSMSPFSEFSHCYDITNEEKYSTMLGFTEREIKHYFKEFIGDMAKHRSNHEKNVTEESILYELKVFSGSYYFSGNFTPLHAAYNPSSIMTYFSKKKASNY